MHLSPLARLARTPQKARRLLMRRWASRREFWPTKWSETMKEEEMSISETPNAGQSRNDFLGILKHISTIHRSLHDARIGRELRVVVVVVTFLALSTAFRISLDVPDTGTLFYPRSLSVSLFDIALLVAFWGLFYYGYWYLKTSARANNINQGIAETAEDVMELDLIDNGNHTIRDCYRKAKGDEYVERLRSRLAQPKQLEIKTHPAKRRWLVQAAVMGTAALVCSIVVVLA